MPASGISLVDANVWLALAVERHVHHAVALRWFDAQPDASCAFCRLTQLAILRHLTNSRILGAVEVMSQRQAWSAVDQFMQDPRVCFLAEPSGLAATFRSLTSKETPSHKQWSDAYLV